MEEDLFLHKDKLGKEKEESSHQFFILIF